MPEKKQGIVVAVLNMKGGVGKTTISAHVMRVLYHRHQLKTLLLDLDPQFNLTQCLTTRKVYEDLKDNGKTILRAMEPSSDVGLFDVATSNKPPPKVSELTRQLRHFTNSDISLDLVAGDFDLVKYSLVNEQQKLDAVHQRFLRFVSQARANYDVVVIDCNPSSSFITLCALHACNHLVVPVQPDRYSILGMELVADLLDRVPSINPKPDISIVLNRIPRKGYNRAVEDELRAHETFGELVLAHRLHTSKLLAATPDYTGFATDKPVPYRTLLKTEISALVDELAERLGITE